MTTVALVGHVDHGKTSLVKALTGVDTDRLPIERATGRTVDLGFARFGIDQASAIGLVDVPGHVRYTRNMVSGLAGISGFLLVVAADDGWMMQTQEHMDALAMLGIRAGCVALTKTDLVDEDLAELATLEISDHLSAYELGDTPVLRVVPTTGDGIEDLALSLAGLRNHRPVSALPESGARVWVDRVFSSRGFGTVVTGTLQGDGLEVGQTLILHPSGVVGRLRGGQVHGSERMSMEPGERVALNLGGVQRHEIERGHLILGDRDVPLTSRVGVELIMPRLDQLKAIEGDLLAHVGTAVISAKVQSPVGEFDDGAPRVATVRLALPLPLTVGDRFLIRDTGQSRLVAGARIIDADMDATGLRGPRVWPALNGRVDQTSTLADALLALLPDDRVHDARIIRRRIGLSHRAYEAVLRHIAERRVAIVSGASFLCTRSTWDRVLLTTTARLESFHREHPLEVGMRREEALRDLLGPGVPAVDVAGLLVRQRHLAGSGERLALPTFASRGSAEQMAAVEALAAAVTTEGHRFPARTDLVQQGFGADLIQAAVRAEALCPLRDDRVTTPCVLRSLVATLAGAFGPEGNFTLVQARDLLGSSRKFVMPLLYYLDDQRITIRMADDRRVLRSEAASQLTGACP